MAKQQKPVKAKKSEQPEFVNSQHLASGVPTVVTDIYGRAWVIDPNDGTARRLTIKR